MISFLYATASGLVGHFLIGFPFGFSFSAVLGLFLERIGQVYFSEGHQLYTKWKEIQIQVILTFAVFAGMRFIAGQALELYPADTFAEIARSGGLVGLFWSRETHINVAREICLTLTLIYLSYSAVISRKRSATLVLIVGAIAAFVRITLRR
jgi:hypothetical protein